MTNEEALDVLLRLTRLEHLLDAHLAPTAVGAGEELHRADEIEAAASAVEDAILDAATALRRLYALLDGVYPDEDLRGERGVAMGHLGFALAWASDAGREAARELRGRTA